MKITITRSNEWIQAQRLATGENVPTQLPVEIEPMDLSERARAILLTNGGRYSDREKINYSDSAPNRYGEAYFLVDAESPTTEQVDAAIIRAADKINADSAEKDKQREENEAARQARKTEDQARADRLNEAKETLGGLIERLEDKITAQQSDLETLSAFIAAIPPDAKRGALRKLAAEETDDAFDRLREETEDAAPEIHILDDLDEDDDED